MQEPLVYIVVLHWINLEDTLGCIDSIININYCNYKVVLVDNNAQPNIKKLINSTYPEIHYYCSGGNLGFSGGMNRGIDIALQNEAKYVCLVNNDVIVDSEYLINLVDVCEKNESVGIAGPLIYYFNENDKINFIYGKVNYWFGTSKHIEGNTKSLFKYDAVIEEDFHDGSVFLIRARLFESIGLLSEKYYFYWEETDFATRAKFDGHRIVSVKSAKIWHKIGASAKSTTPLFVLYNFYRGKLIYIIRCLRFYYWPSAILYYLASLIFTIVKVSVKFLIIYNHDKK